MRSILTEENAVTIWLSGEPVPGREEILSLVKRSLAERGYAAWPDTEAECFAAGEEALVIARPGHAYRTAFFFEELADVLCAAASVPEGTGGLYAVPEGYILLTEPEDIDRPCLREFGTAVRISPLWEFYARERGWCLIPENAPSVLEELFRQE